MQTLVKTPGGIFNAPQHLEIPLFQRRYVWEKEEQWEPLWGDLLRLVAARSTTPTATHFMGAIVLQQLPNSVGGVQRWSVIDGQQRLTTLQILMDAVGAELEHLGERRQANRLRKLTHNDEDDLPDSPDLDDAETLKLRHLNADRAGFVDVMLAEPPVNYADLRDRDGRIVRAHEHFAGLARAWLSESADQLGMRATGIVDALREGLQLVTIDLQADEDSQEIFETLNARGTPLTAADLIKNLLFQRLEQERGDARQAYQKYWHLFETPFWEKEISVGRFLQPRSAVFLTQWLVSRTGEEVQTRSTFRRFKYFVEHEYTGTTMQLLGLIHEQAVAYGEWTKAASGRETAISAVALAVYRMESANLEVAKPLLLWLHEPDDPKPAHEVAEVLAAVESWIMRRMLMRLTTSALGRVVANLIKSFRGTPADGLGERVRVALSRENSESTYWPGNSEVRRVVEELPAYRAYSRSRLRMILEAAEDARRGYSSGRPSRTGSRIERRAMHIEHVLPQRWTTHWPVVGLRAELDRADHVHRIGNLTLLTASLNSGVSNAEWATKRAALNAHDVNLLTRDLRDKEEWGEATIDARSADIVDLLLQTWTVPEGHVGEVQTEREPTIWVDLAQIVAAGMIQAGTVLDSRSDRPAKAVVTDKGLLEVDGKQFESPSGAARHVVGYTPNGWTFWRLPDGRRLRDVRDDYMAWLSAAEHR
ncbi:DUF262 domain-containing protein [Luteipulveratus sp. YIM 133132]|uniref:GmrSD restriction endonuclease domain-containing protein n=1 Tax=Luteipulveratus flavus TaxID=3031728 RepID=UPI0023B1AC5F|nr:DUF262 domain-containing protein [Luteipulveratus sp. YIM 133132]MDE9367240.1 DUF262 domain-containing protein [Luteipulveratus sp. YIM 133132]